MKRGMRILPDPLKWALEVPGSAPLVVTCTVLNEMV